MQITHKHILIGVKQNYNFPFQVINQNMSFLFVEKKMIYEL